MRKYRGMSWAQLIEMSVAAGGPIDVRTAAPACALTVRAVRDRARREAWWRPFPNIVAVPGTQRDGRAWAKAATLHAAGRRGDPGGAPDRDCDGDPGGDAGPGHGRHRGRHLAALTRSSALALFGVQRSFPTRNEVVIHASRVLQPSPRLDIVRSTLLVSEEVGVRGGVPVVVGPALLRDLAAVREREALRRATIDLAKAGVLDLDALPAFLATQPAFPGKTRLRQVTADLFGAGRTDSPFELEVRERLAEEGIALDRGQVPLPGSSGIHLDLGILAIRFGIELHSLGFHASRADLERDLARANAIAALDGWRVLYATWSVLTGGWDAFVAQVRDVIAAQSRAHLGLDWPTATALNRS